MFLLAFFYIDSLSSSIRIRGFDFEIFPANRWYNRAGVCILCHRLTNVSKCKQKGCFVFFALKNVSYPVFVGTYH